MQILSLFKKIPRNLVIHAALLIGSITLIIFHRLDADYKYNIPLVIAWAVLFFLAAVFFFIKKKHVITQSQSLWAPEEWMFVLIVILCAIVTRTLFLGTYPYVTVGDELRDTGLNGLYIKKGMVPDVFGFGSYEGYGNLIPFISYLFQFVFSTSRFAYIIPTTIVGVISIFLTYIVGRKLGGRICGFIGAIFVTVSIFHLHYSRTELVIVSDTLLSPIVLISTAWALHDRKALYLAGLVYGLTMHFYAGVRGMMFACVLYLVFYMFFRLIWAFKKDRLNGFTEIKAYFLAVILFLMGLCIGLGPTVNNLGLHTAMSNTGDTGLVFKNAEFKKEPFVKKVAILSSSYQKSLLTYVFKPVGSHFPYRDMALLAFPVNWLFLVGIGYFFMERGTGKSIRHLIGFLIFMFPITNQVLIADTLADHRLMSLIPLLNVVAAYGFVKICNQKFQRFASIILGSVVGIFFVSQLMFYFHDRPSDIGYQNEAPKEYMLQAIVDYAKLQNDEQAWYLVNNNPYDYNFDHYKEKIEYLMYPRTIGLIEKTELIDTLLAQPEQAKRLAILYISNLQELDRYKKITVTTVCAQPGYFPNYRCPIGSTVDYSFMVARID